MFSYESGICMYYFRNSGDPIIPTKEKYYEKIQKNTFEYYICKQ